MSRLCTGESFSLASFQSDTSPHVSCTAEIIQCDVRIVLSREASMVWGLGETPAPARHLQTGDAVNGYGLTLIPVRHLESGNAVSR